MRAIVGAQIGSKITNSVPLIIQAVKNGTVTRWLSQEEMRMMSRLDLGKNWDHMASSQVLFCLDDDGKPHSVEEGKDVEMTEKPINKWRCPLCKLEFDEPLYGANGNETWVPCCPECEEPHIERIDTSEFRKAVEND